MLSRFLLTFVLFTCALAADTPMSTIRVEVKTLADKPVDRASVVVQFVEGRSIVKLGKKIMTRWEVRTNQEGIAKVPALPQGKIRIQVIAKGFQTYGGIHEANEATETITIKLNPPQPQYTAH